MFDTTGQFKAVRVCVSLGFKGWAPHMDQMALLQCVRLTYMCVISIINTHIVSFQSFVGPLILSKVKLNSLDRFLKGQGYKQINM